MTLALNNSIVQLDTFHTSEASYSRPAAMDPQDTNPKYLAEREVQTQVQQEPYETAAIFPQRHYDNGAYFCQSARSDSESGFVAAEDEVLSEEQIVQFVRNSNPSLFVRLNGMVFQSSYLPGDGVGWSKQSDGSQFLKFGKKQRKTKLAVVEEESAEEDSDGRATKHKRKLEMVVTKECNDTCVDCPSEPDTDMLKQIQHEIHFRKDTPRCLWRRLLTYRS